MASGTVAVPAGAVTVTVLGAFGSTSYPVVVTPNWTTTADVSSTLASQFTVVFGVPAPPGGGILRWIADIPAAAALPVPGCITAGTLITRLRAKIPDSVFVNDVPQPEVDGKFRVQTLYGWLDDASQVLTQLTGWTLADWWAIRQVARQPWYAVDPHFVSVDSANSNQFDLNVIVIDEADTIWPNSLGPIATQPLSAYVRKLGDALEVGVWPVPPTTDPATTLNGAINPSGADPILVASTSGFLSFGYVQIEDELIAYQQLVSSPSPALGVISRAIGGTTAAAHADGSRVTHLGLWVKGRRLPATILNSQTCVEVPRGWMSHLETYVLGQCRIAQKRHAEGERLIAQFEKACAGINADPNWKVNRGQIRPYGSPLMGPIYYGRGGQGLIVPALLLMGGSLLAMLT